MGARHGSAAARVGGAAGLADAIVHWTRTREGEMARILAELVRVPTENPPGNNYAAITRVLEKHLRGFGLTVQRLQPAKSAKANDSAVSRGENSACLLAGYG